MKLSELEAMAWLRDHSGCKCSCTSCIRERDTIIDHARTVLPKLLRIARAAKNLSDLADAGPPSYASIAAIRQECKGVEL